MKKMLYSIAPVLLSLAVLAGCGSSSTNAARGDSSSAVASSSDAFDTAGWNESADIPAMAETENALGSLTGAALPENAKLIYRADISLETTEFDAASEKLASLVSDLGGYFERSSVDSYGSYRYGSYVVRVPAEKFGTLCESVGGLAQLNSISRSADDVSESYYDVEARLKTQQTKLTRLQELLVEASSMEDIITIESSISDTELQIEYLTGQLRQYDSLIGYSTVNIDLNEVYRLSGTEEPAIGFGAKLASAFKHGARSFVSGCESFVLFVASNWAGLILLAVIVVVVVVVMRKVKIRRNQPPKSDK